jgi:serine/threonine protein kinase
LETLYARRASFSTLQVLIEQIYDSRLPFLPFTEIISDIGQGGQFIVHKARAGAGPARFVAIKQPKFDLDLNKPLNLTEPRALRDLYSVYREIAALTHPILIQHPNIVRILGWSYDHVSLNSIPRIVLELASGNLSFYLQNDAKIFSLRVLRMLFQDVAGGIDVLHDCGLVHGDVKPENILLYLYSSRIVAKVADFGLSIQETGLDNTLQILGGTPGWQAPEVEEGRSLSVSECFKTDNFSFGLLIWSAVLHGGRAPPKSAERSQRAFAMKEFEHSQYDEDDEDLLYQFSEIVNSLLEKDACQRPDRLEILISSKQGPANTNENEAIEHSVISDSISAETGLEYFWESVFIWELPHLPGFFVKPLIAVFRQDPGAVTADTLFSIFMWGSTESDYRGFSDVELLDLLTISASAGYRPARASIPSALRYYCLEPSSEVKANLEDWLEDAASMGSTLAAHELETINATKSQSALKNFRAQGGYNRWYSPPNPDPDLVFTEPRQNLMNGYTELHKLAAYGSLAELENFLENFPEYINSKSETQETPLYLACARGSFDIVSKLLDYGADPSIVCTDSQISCLHWLFAFDNDHQVQVVRSFSERGAKINALATYEVPFFHYPFVLPSGTPLHWAVATSSYHAIVALVQCGADPLIRDGSDPYHYDDGIRVHRRHDHSLDPNLDYCFFHKHKTRGLSSLDLAAMLVDPFIFELLSARNEPIDVNQVDEEGFSALYRLNRSRIGRTNTCVKFSRHVFREGKTSQEDRLHRTLKALKELGADLDRMTKPGAVEYDMEYDRSSEQEPSQPPSRTALMLAASDGEADLVAALLNAGASVNVQNEEGEQALDYLGRETRGSYLECAKLLVSHGANVNHRPNNQFQAIILRAAESQDTALVEFLISAGADITVTDYWTPLVGSIPNIFFLLHVEDKAFEDFRDTSLLRLLQQYVLNEQDRLKVHIFTNLASESGTSLLHIYAEAGFVKCVQALLDNGASVNAIRKRAWLVGRVGSEIERTPLDLAVMAKRKRQKIMLRDKQHLRAEYDYLIKRDSAVIDLLQRYGGIQVAEGNEAEDPFVGTYWYV